MNDCILSYIFKENLLRTNDFIDSITSNKSKIVIFFDDVGCHLLS
jgi:hypothetical protein